MKIMSVTDSSSYIELLQFKLSYRYAAVLILQL